MKTTLFSLLFAISLAGCVSRFDEAMDAGRALASRGDWDAAAEQFEQAHRLEPDDEVAWDELMSARRNQARARVAASTTALGEQRWVDAYRLGREAAALDPGSADAAAASTAARSALVRAIQTRLDQRPREALALARELLRSEPDAPDARSLFGEARDKTAAAAVAQGDARDRAGDAFGAWLSYAEATNLLGESVPAKQKMDAVQRRVVEASTFHVLMGSFNGDPRAADLGAQVGPADLARGIDPALLLRVDDRPLPAQGRFRGIRLGGAFRDYAFARSLRSETASCNYVCGYDTVANPERPAVESALRAARHDERRAEGALARAQAERRAVEERRMSTERTAESARVELRAAEDRLATCRREPQKDCTAEGTTADAARRASRAADDAAADAASSATLSQQALSSAEGTAQRARDARASAEHRLETTPPFVDVPRSCSFAYERRFAAEEATIDLALQAESLYDTTLVLDEVVRGKRRAEDQAHDAAPGRCAEVASADPMRLPGEASLRASAVDDAVGRARAIVVRAYDAYRTDLAAEQRRAETSANDRDALGAAVALALTARTEADAAKSAEAIARLADVPADAVVFALGRAFAARVRPPT